MLRNDGWPRDEDVGQPLPVSKVKQAQKGARRLLCAIATTVVAIGFHKKHKIYAPVPVWVLWTASTQIRSQKAQLSRKYNPHPIHDPRKMPTRFLNLPCVCI